MVNVGIYRITCAANGHMYFGSSWKLKKRLYDHRRLLIRGEHSNRCLQSDWNLYGSEAFEFKVLIRHNLSRFKLLALENLFIHAYWDKQVCCYNSAQDARSSQGRAVSEATKAKISASLTGRKASVESRLHQSEARRGAPHKKGYKVSIETRAKQSRARMGHETSEETRAKQSASNRATWIRKHALTGGDPC